MNRESVHHKDCGRAVDHSGSCTDGYSKWLNRRDPKREDRKSDERRKHHARLEYMKTAENNFLRHYWDLSGCAACRVDRRAPWTGRHSERRKADKGEHLPDVLYQGRNIGHDMRNCPACAPVVHTVEAAKEKTMKQVDVSFGAVPQTEEVQFAKGSDIETQNIRVTYANLAEFTNPTARFPQIYKTHGNGDVTTLGLTPAEGRYLRDVLTKMFPEKS